MITGKEYFLNEVNTQYKFAAFYLMQPDRFRHFSTEDLETMKELSQYPGLKIVDCEGVQIPELACPLISILFKNIKNIQFATGCYPDLDLIIYQLSNELLGLPKIKGKPKTDDGLEIKLRRIDLVALEKLFTKINSFLTGELDNEVGFDELMVILVTIAIDHFQEKASVFENYHDKSFRIPFGYLQPRGGPKKIRPCICENCDKLFIRHSQSARYCPECRSGIKTELQRRRRKERKDERPQRYCKNCGKPLPNGNLKGEYCKNEGKCRVAYHRKKIKEM